MQLVLADRLVDLDTGRVSTGGQLRPMELRLLRYLMRRAGAVVSAKELLVEVWGYAPTLRTATVYSTIYRLRSAIEADPKQPRHLITISSSGVRLDGIHSAHRGDTNLPPSRDRLIGGDRELEAIGAPGARLVTLVGPSGIGKTRLAIEWATASSGSFPTGRWLVEATGVSSPSDLADCVARVLRVDTDRLVDTFAQGGLLLLIDDLPLDRFGITDLLVQWLDAGPLTLLVTAHDALRLRGERVVAVAPLALPAEPTALDAPAVALLIDRIRQWAPSFRPEDHERELSELAIALDGIPLALEIAAAHVAALGPAVTLDTLRRRALGSPRHDAPRRHCSIVAMLECTWERLPGWGQKALRQLAAFHRSFTLESANAILELPPSAPSPTEAVSSLVVRGLVTPMSTAPNRFRTSDIVGDFVRSKGIDPRAMERLVALYAGHARAVLQDGAPEEVAAPDAAELDEWHHVARWVLRDHGVEGERGAIPVFAYVAAVAASRHTLAEAMAERLEDRPLVGACRAWFTTTRALWLLRRSRSPEAVAYAESVLGLLRELEVPVLSTLYAFALAVALVNTGDRRAAQAAYASGVVTRASLRPPRRLARWLELRERTVACALQAGEPAAEAAARRAVRLAEELGQDATPHVLHLVIALFDLDRVEDAEAVLRGHVQARTVLDRIRVLTLRARIALHCCDPAEAIELCDRAEEETRDAPAPEPLVGWVRLARGHARLCAGDFDGAEAEAGVLTLHPFYGTPRMRLAVAHLRATIAAVQRSAAAVPMLEALIERATHQQIRSITMSAIEVLAEVRAVSGDWEAALTALDRAERLVRCPWQLRMRAEALRGLGRRAEALAVLERAATQPDPAPWIVHATAAAASDLGVETSAGGVPLKSHPWTRVYLARIALNSGADTRARSLLDGVVHPNSLLLAAAIAELQARSVGR
jgi:tetratricopeptide (TPR) repeat protein